MELHIKLEMSSPKRPAPEFFDIEPPKKFKRESSKENIPPTISENFEKNCNSRDSEHHVKGTPKKRVEKDDPVTPNTNFKMLTSIAAGLDYANCNSPKSRNSSECAVSLDNVECVDNPVFRVNRKEKSLAIICSRFLLMYPLHPENNSSVIVSLDDVCLKLGVERRRLYDIVNVFESIDMLKKLAKNKYLWFGKIHLSSALWSIKKAAEKENVLAKLQYVLDHEGNGIELKQSSCILDEVQEFTQTFEAESSQSSALRRLLQPSSPLPELRKEKSLAIMSQKFLMLFLVSPAKVISLGVAAKVLNGFQKTERATQIKTQIRRLYDIANVLSSIGLISKEITVSFHGRKPAFKYTGPNPEELETLSKKSDNFLMNHSKKQNNNETSRSLSRHRSFQEICAVAEMEHKRICLEETANSAPPFENSILKSDKTLCKTSFSNLNLTGKDDTENVRPDEWNINTSSCAKKSVMCSTAFQSILPKMSSKDSKNIVPQPKPFTMQGQANLKVINVPKEMFSANGAYYILNPTNNNGAKSPTPLGALLLISPLPVPNSEIPDIKTSHNKVLVPQKGDLTNVQQDTILQVINSNQQNKQPGNISRCRSPRRNLTQLIKDMQSAENERLQTESMIVNRLKSISREISLNNGDSSESSGVYSTRNSSPSSSRFDSPLSIPSGYATPVPTSSSDFSFLSNKETRSILKNIESQPNCDVSLENKIKKENITCKINTQNYVPNVEGKVISNIRLSSWQNMQKLPSFSNNGSNDSVNSEVSEILKDKRLGEDATKVKPFLIDEKTILSPIKSKGEIGNRTLTPSPFITPPYTPSDAIFEFKNLELKKCP